MLRLRGKNSDFLSRRSESVAFSRSQTPSQIQHQDLGPYGTPVVNDSESLYGSNPYDAHGPYDSDFAAGAGPSGSGRKIIAYDDPYADAYPPPTMETDSNEATPPASTIPSTASTSTAPSSPTLTRSGDDHGQRGRRGRGRGRNSSDSGGRGGRGRGRGNDRTRGRGRGRGGYPGNIDTIGAGWQQQGSGPTSANSMSPVTSREEYDPRSSFNLSGATTGQRRELSPTSFAIARATGQHSDGSTYGNGGVQGWGYAQQQQQFAGGGAFGYDEGYGGQQQFVQPHINPRFAAQFGMGFTEQWSPNQYEAQGWGGMADWQQGGYGDDQGQGYDGTGR